MQANWIDGSKAWNRDAWKRQSAKGNQRQFRNHAVDDKTDVRSNNADNVTGNRGKLGHVIDDLGNRGLAKRANDRNQADVGTNAVGKVGSIGDHPANNLGGQCPDNSSGSSDSLVNRTKDKISSNAKRPRSEHQGKIGSGLTFFNSS